MRFFYILLLFYSIIRPLFSDTYKLSMHQTFSRFALVLCASLATTTSLHAEESVVP
ncbi:hypothetical protein, partial [Vibrio mediterranei]|uniref:hypothetical protein n=1 Tax=Vibrio mediterranei TaxID=689 RepID=UPI003BF8AE3D